MKYIIILVLTSMMTACSAVNRLTEKNNQLTKAEQEAITKLQKIHSDIELGLNMIEYSENIKEAKFAVEQVNQNSKAIKPLEKAIKGHTVALNWWQCDLEVKDTFDPYKCRDELLLSLYDYSSDIEEKVIPLIENDSSLPKTWHINNEQMLHFIWLKTQQDLIDAELAILNQ